MVSRFEALCVRPPTPPPSKDLDTAGDDADDLLDFLSDPFAAHAAHSKTPIAALGAAKPLLSTPQTSPSSDAAIPSSSGRRKKRVNFDSVACAIPSASAPRPSSRTATPLHSSPLRPLPQTRLSKPLKSILKPMDAASTPPPANESTPAHKYKSFAEMLESIMKQLASPTRASRCDAYHALHRTMQAYDKIPDMQALQDKMTLLTQFVRRDVQAVGINGSGLDSQLVGQALKLLMALVRISELRPAMTDDFCIFIVERIIQVASDKDMPKTIVNTHLAMIMQQNFRPRVMTAARVERTLDFLDNIQDRITGQSVLAYRIRIYRKLIQQKPEVMAKHTERWFKHTVQSLLSPQKDINQSALDTAITAAKTIGADRHVSKGVLTVLNQPRKDGDTIAKTVIKELEKMLASENAVLVPQVWSAITALLTGSLKLLPALADWLKLFHECLNSQDEAVKVHVNVAFGFLIHALNIQEDTEAKWTKVCLALPRYQLQHPRRGQWKTSEREAATSAYFLLLYYSLNPMASHKQLDRYWKEFVADFWTPPDSAMSPVHAMAACRVVSALLNGSRRPWDSQRALDLRPQVMMQRDELPLLDPRWVRKALAVILGFVETLLDATPWAMDDTKDEPAKTMWLSLLQSLNAASSQEVMASSETKDAIAHIINLLRRMWDTHAAQLALSQQKEDNWANKFCHLLETAIEKLGAFQFADKCIARNLQDEIEVATTPSRSRQQGPRTSPLLYFVDLLVNESEGGLADCVRLRAIKLLVEPCFKSQTTRLAKLEMLRDCCSAIKGSENAVTITFLDLVAVLMKDCIPEKLDANSRGSHQLGKEYELVVETLSLGSSRFLKQQHGQELLSYFAETVKGEAGDGAVVLAVIEKVSERILVPLSESNRRHGLPCLSVLLQVLPKMISRRTIEQARQELWPSSPNPGRNVDFDPYNFFYTATIAIGSAAYRELSAYDTEEIRGFLRALANSIRSCSIAMLAVYLRRIQETICLWVEDVDKRMQVKEQPIKDLHTEVVNLWKEACAAVERLPNKNSQTLAHLEPLITAGFSSRRHSIIIRSVATWNATFGKQDTLQYPTRLENALRQLRNAVELSLPSLEGRETDAPAPISFYDSDDGSEAPTRKFLSPRVKESPFRVNKSSRKSRSPAIPSANSRRNSTRSNPKGRLRHDNSQIQFEPIDSSPTNPFVQESQFLTERQRKVLERQGVDNNLFANIGSASSPARPKAAMSAQSPLEIHSDALSGDDLPMEDARTPLRRIPPVGPMDVFVGSSPTPRARSRNQEVLSDQTSVATPTAVRSIQILDDDELGSSPPRFERDMEPKATVFMSNDTSKDVVTDSFEYTHGNISISTSFDEGTIVYDSAQPETDDIDMADVEGGTPKIEPSDLPSSTVDLQLTAQINAEMEGHGEADDHKPSRKGGKKMEKEAFTARAARISQQSEGMEAENDTEVGSQVATPTQVHKSTRNARSISRVRGSFSSQPSQAESSPVSSVRRSSRHSTATCSPAPLSKRGRSRKAKEDVQRGSLAQTPADDGLHDNIIVATAKSPHVPTPTGTKKTRKSLPAKLQSESTLPESIRKRGVSRSASLLSHVETQSEDVVVEDTSGLKRARRSISQDVSGAKAKRLNHVRVTPKGLRSTRSSEASEDVSQEMASVGEQKEEVAQQLADGTLTSDGSQQKQSPSQQTTGEAGEVATPSRSFADRVILTPRSIINQLWDLKDKIFRSSQLVLGRQEEREIDDALFDIRRGIHAAGARRSENGGNDEGQGEQ
ncbi:hypothetical protein P280DRAFT_540852 [Massarina eburnea CBS 473.64]|uniref:Telomere-associated protein Rif1 N-terminal domain-containing protein n=1 Tax=Massarina eburnea CBS 473.64 TaxID=1395130 RepID=A0A6A6S9L3_9PLEO|nr:hypothetical protein P280DRAFT_540852 [Massarina eburnea CBS 473.64]